jgi:DNA-binding GntR family transcriptional regulator
VVDTFEPVPNRTLRDEVLLPLRKAILFGQIATGDRLVEAEIAGRMGVSRVPVREALAQLEREGLVEQFPHRGSIVAAVDEDEVDLLYFLRAELESYCIQSVMLCGGTADLLAELTTLLEQMRAAARNGKLYKLAEQDLAFHQAIVARSAYRTLGRVWNSMDGPVRARSLRIISGPGKEPLIAYTAESHRPIVDAVATGDPMRAVIAVKEHIIETRRLLDRPVAAE